MPKLCSWWEVVPAVKTSMIVIEKKQQQKNRGFTRTTYASVDLWI